MKLWRLLLTLLSVCSLATVDAYGSSTTLAPMFSLFNETAPNSDSYFICALQASSLIPICDGTIKVNSTYYGFPPANTSFLAISAGGRFTCGLVFGSRTPVCWGEPEVEVPELYQNMSYIDIASGGFHACALQASGVADCWGSNEYGQTEAPKNITFTALTCGDRFSCGLTQGSRLAVCWGYRAVGFYGLQMPETERFIQVAAGAFHVCGILESNNTAVCWGSNKNEQSIPPVGKKFSQLSIGNDHSCGLLLETGEAECWGGNSQLPLELSGMPFITLVAGDYYNCAVGVQLELKCWGYSRSATSRFAAVKVAPTTCTTMDCNGNQYKLSGQLCPEKQYHVCIEKLIASSTSKESSQGNLRTVLITLVVICCGLATAGAIIFIHRRRRFASQDSSETEELSLELHQEWESQARRVQSFTKHGLQVATSNYSNASTLGTGSFGVVYKGILPNGQMVAIKKPKNEARINSFTAELKLLARLNHANLVNLIGYCQQESCLIFEYMANGSLYDCLFRRNIKLNWTTRLQIAAQAARGLEYLHIYAVPGIIHRDIKSSNILLDQGFNARVADFGLSMLGPLGNLSHITNTTLVGTPGYLDPEYFQTMKLSTKSDVYSFGIVLLELFTGRRAVDAADSDNVGIVSWVTNLKDEIAALDSSLPLPEQAQPLFEALGMAKCCTNLRGSDRPSMSYVASSMEKFLSAMLVSESPSESSSAENVEETPSPR